MLARLDAHDASVDEISIEDIEVDDPAFETLLIGRAVKVLLQDVDRVRWRQDLIEDRNRLDTLLSAARQVVPARDDKLYRLRGLIQKRHRGLPLLLLPAARFFRNQVQIVLLRHEEVSASTLN